MKEILPGIRQWSWLSPEKGIDFNGLYVNAGGETLLIDPPAFGDGDEAEIRRLGPPGSIIVTNRHHGRRAAEYRDLFRAKILVPVADSSFLTFSIDGTFSPGDPLPGGFAAVAVPDSKT